jgi:signal transduction histidine kinase
MIVVFQVQRTSERLLADRAQVEVQRKRLAEERAAELDMFAARMAHDIRNPLSAVALQLELAARHPERAASPLGRGRAALRHADAILDGLLAFARAGGTPAPGERARLSEVISATVTDLSGAAERDDVRLIVEPFADLAVACSFGPVLSILQNLVKNAIKYLGATVDRRVTVRVACRGATARVEVEDTGPGIAPELRSRVFEPYVRGAHPGRDGIGLGLATVKRLVEAHGGAVGIDPGRAGTGSCFWFELPRAPDEGAPRTEPLH